jgi:hypothetical protein
MRSSRAASLLALVALLWSSNAFAQRAARRAVTPAAAAATGADPFVGVWKLSAEKSKYESGGAPKSFVRTYEDRGGGTIFMTTDVTVPQGSTRAYLVYRRDGKPYPEAAVGADAIRMVTVKSVDRRTEDVYFIVDGKTSDKPSTITISGDGMTMTQVVNGTTSKGKPFTNTVVYDRQP